MIGYVRNELINMSDKGDYATFTSSLIPGCNNVIGVRQPVLKKYAKQLLSENKDFRQLLLEPDIYHEETLLRGYIIGMGTAKEKDFDKALKDFKEFIPLVNNWAVNDSFCVEFKVMDMYRQEFLPYIRECIASGDEYKARIGLIMLLDHYLKVDAAGNKKPRMKRVTLNDIGVEVVKAVESSRNIESPRNIESLKDIGISKDLENAAEIENKKSTDVTKKSDYQYNEKSNEKGMYLEEILSLINRDFSANGYYTQMAAGWLLAECFVTFPKKTWEYLTDKDNMKLDKVSYKKAIRKICESLTPDNNVKNICKEIIKKF